MTERASTRLYRILFGLTGLIAVAYQFYARSQIDPFNPVNYFSYFTILSNILIFSLFLLGGISNRVSSSEVYEKWRGAAVVYMLVTGLIYFTLLRGLEESLQTPIPWVNTILHYVMPLAAIIDWMMDRPRVKLRLSIVWKWFMFPVVYLVYSLVRGQLTAFYPYPFLNVDTQGLSTVLLVSGIIVLVFLSLSLFVIWIGNKRERT